MKLSMLLSPGLWDLLERLRPHLDVTIELYEPSLTPLLPDRDDDVATALRRAVLGDGTPQSERLRSVLRTGQHQVISADGLLAALFPLRRDRDVVGVVAVAQRGGADTSATSPSAQRLERLGWSLRSTLEADINTHGRLDDEERRSRWLTTVLRFLEHLHQCADEHDLFATLVEGAAIWGDVDARIYRRDLTGDFVLAAALPSVLAEGAAPTRLNPAAIDPETGLTRVSSIAELEQLGWSAATGELLLIRHTQGDPSEFVLAVAGNVAPELERALLVACRTLGACVDRLASARSRALHAQLLERLAASQLRFPAPATLLLSDLAAAIGAVHGRLLLRERDGDPPRTLGAVGGSPIGLMPADLPVRGVVRHPHRLVVTLAVSGGPAWVDLGAAPGRAFTAGDAALAEAAASVFEAWLTGAAQAAGLHGGLAARLSARGFETRIQEELERARRFNLEAGLLLLSTLDRVDDRHALALTPILEAMRSQLRASDLIGRLATGELAALLVHTTARGVIRVAERVQEQLVALRGDPHVPPTVLGAAAYPSAGETVAALLRAAREDLGRHAAGSMRELRRVATT